MTTVYYVEYGIQGMGQHKSGPYGTWQEAERNRDDIAGYEGIFGAKILPYEDLKTRFDIIG